MLLLLGWFGLVWFVGERLSFFGVLCSPITSPIHSADSGGRKEEGSAGLVVLVKLAFAADRRQRETLTFRLDRIIMKEDLKRE